MGTKAAFSIWEDRVAPVFDVARRVRIVEADSGRVVAAADESLPEDAPAVRARRLADLGVATLVCGAISRPVPDAVAALHPGDAARRSPVRRLGDRRKADLVRDPRRGAGRIQVEPGAVDPPPRPDRQPAGLEDGLRQDLVHPERRAEDAGADAGDAGEIEQPLNPPVLAPPSVEDREQDVDRNPARGPVRLDPQQPPPSRIGDQPGPVVVAALGLVGPRGSSFEHAPRTLRREPAPFSRHGERDDPVPPRVQAGGHAARRDDGNLVFDRSPAEQQAHAEPRRAHGAPPSRGAPCESALRIAESSTASGPAPRATTRPPESRRTCSGIRSTANASPASPLASNRTFPGGPDRAAKLASRSTLWRAGTPTRTRR